MTPVKRTAGGKRGLNVTHGEQKRPSHKTMHALWYSQPTAHTTRAHHGKHYIKRTHPDGCSGVFAISQNDQTPVNEACKDLKCPKPCNIEYCRIYSMTVMGELSGCVVRKCRFRQRVLPPNQHICFFASHFALHMRRKLVRYTQHPTLTSKSAPDP